MVRGGYGDAWLHGAQGREDGLSAVGHARWTKVGRVVAKRSGAKGDVG